MATVTFTKGATSITIKAPRYPENYAKSYPMIVGKTWGGGHKVCDLGDGSTQQDRPPLIFRDLDPADWASLYGFIETTLVWSTNLFTYTDPHNTQHTNMRYISGLAQAWSNKGKWNLDLVIEKDLGA